MYNSSSVTCFQQSIMQRQAPASGAAALAGRIKLILCGCAFLVYRECKQIYAGPLMGARSLLCAAGECSVVVISDGRAYGLVCGEYISYLLYLANTRVPSREQQAVSCKSATHSHLLMARVHKANC
jgi:hypothetical protein